MRLQRPIEYQLIKRELTERVKKDDHLSMHDYNSLLLECNDRAYEKMEGIDKDWIEAMVEKMHDMKGYTKSVSLEILASLGNSADIIWVIPEGSD